MATAHNIDKMRRRTNERIEEGYDDFFVRKRERED